MSTQALYKMAHWQIHDLIAAIPRDSSIQEGGTLRWHMQRSFLLRSFLADVRRRSRLGGHHFRYEAITIGLAAIAIGPEAIRLGAIALASALIEGFPQVFFGF